MGERREDPNEANFRGEMLFIDPAVPIRLVVTIDNADGGEFPDNPFTLNASVGANPYAMTELLFDGEGALIEGDVPSQLRTLATLIEEGRVYR